MNKMRPFKLLACFAGLLSLFAAQAADSPTPASAAGLLKSGQESAQFCRHCHGIGGTSVHADIPNLAGQNAAYLLDQMNKFAAGKRKSEFMEGLIKALKPEERASIALYFSQQKVMPKPVKNSAGFEEGKILYSKLCINCHGEHAYGTETIPRLASQQTQYIEISLKRYRDGSGERIEPRMAAYTRNLKDRDIENLATYLSSLR
ncbi:MAG: cytochrome c4 [Hydrogenophilaceae bacterium]|nr:cytochrome c4 [Hydrogenophilaceae bacterium]